MGELSLRGLTVRYGAEAVVEDFSLEVKQGELVSLLGPSGAGKTTILKAIAGLIEPERGDVKIDGRSVLGVPPERREAVMVFQKPLLFPFMNVEQNVGFGLRMRGVKGEQARARIERMLELMDLSGYGGRRAHELSGGQQQRVSLARALALKPAVLLLDEPLASLDANLRQRMRELLGEVQAETGTTTVLVTHDQAEALTLSHRVALLLGGRLRQTGTPRELFHQPADPEVADFFGCPNLIKGSLGDGSGALSTIRPEDVILGAAGAGVDGRVERVGFEGSGTRYWVRCGEMELVVVSKDGGYEAGDEVGVIAPPDKIWAFPGKS